jgi:hypothetical protein
MSSVLDLLCIDADFVVLLTAPVADADGLAVMLAADHAVPVATDRVTTHDQLEQTLGVLRRLGVDVAGLLLTRRGGRRPEREFAALKAFRGRPAPGFPTGPPVVAADRPLDRPAAANRVASVPPPAHRSTPTIGQPPYPADTTAATGTSRTRTHPPRQP